MNGTSPIQPLLYAPAWAGQTTKFPESGHGPHSSMANAKPSMHLLWQWPLFLIGAMALLGTGLFHALRAPSHREVFENALRAAHQALRDNDYRQALHHAKIAWAHSFVEPARAGEIRFVMGSSYLLGRQSADPTLTEETVLKRAKTDLESARLLGVPAAFKATLAYRLALAHDATGSRPEVVAVLLDDSLVPESPHRSESYALLYSLYERLSPPRHEEMLKIVERWLMLPHVDQPNAVRLKQAKLLIHLQQFEKAKQALARIPASAQEYSEARQLWGQCLIENETWSEAVAVWKELTATATSVQERRAGQYWLGLAYFHSSKIEEALRQWEPLLREAKCDPPALAARVQLLRLHQSRKDLVTSGNLLETTFPLLKSSDCASPFLKQDELTCLLQQLWQGWLELEAYDLAFRAIELAQGVVDEHTQDRWFARAYQAAGQAWLRDTSKQNLAQPAPLPERSRQAFLKAGHALARLAQAEEVGPRQDELYWQAGTCWLRAQDYQKAITVLEPLRQRPLPAARQWELLTGLGEAYRAVQQRDRAMQVLAEVARTHEPLAVRAKYLIALTLVDDRQFDEAENKLKQLIQSTPAIPEPVEIRQARFALGSVLYQQRKYEEAAQRFEAYTMAYPDDAHHWAARYWWSEAARHATLQFAERAMSSQIAQATQYFQQRYQNGLNRAFELSSKLVEDLQKQKEAGTWSAELAGYLNSSRLALAELQMKLLRAEEAITSYKFLALELGGQPEGLNALLGLFHAYMLAKKPDHARQVLPRLRETLANLSDDVLLQRGMNRIAWQKLILELEQSLP